MAHRTGVTQFRAGPAEEMVKTAVRLPAALKEAMEELADHYQRSFSAETIIAIRGHIGRENRRRQAETVECSLEDTRTPKH